MKKVLLTSIFGLFLLAGTGLVLIADEPTAQQAKAEASCCETAAKTADAGCTSTPAVQTASTRAAASDCGSQPVQTANAEKASDCGSTAVQTASTSATGGCGTPAVQTVSTQAAGDCGTPAVQTVSTSAAGDCGTPAVQTAATKAAGDCGAPAVQTAETVTGDCVKRPAGISTQRAENR